MKSVFFTLLIVFNALIFLIGCGTTNPVHQTTKENPVQIPAYTRIKESIYGWWAGKRY